MEAITKELAEAAEELIAVAKAKPGQILFWGAPKSLHMVTAAMKLKDTCSLGKKL